MLFECFTLVRRRQPYEQLIDPRLSLTAGDEFPQELVEAITCRIEPTELCSFKLVSKGFKKLISSKYFLQKHLHQMEQLNHSVFVFQEEFAYAPLYCHIEGAHGPYNGIFSTHDRSEIEILTSSEALLLYYDSLDDFYLLNPTTNETRMLPTCQIAYPSGCTSAHVFFGMGYVFEEDDYKILRVATFDHLEHLTEVMMYSRNSGEWLRSAEFPTNSSISHSGIHVSGHLHWITSNLNNEYSITTFNLKTSSYATMKMPDVPNSYGLLKLVSLDSNTIALTQTLIDGGTIYMIWILKDYTDEESWYRVDIDLAGIVYNFGLVTVRPMSLIQPEKQKILLRIDPSAVIGIYDIEEKIFNQLEDEDLGAGYMNTYRFIPTLHSPHPTV